MKKLIAILAIYVFAIQATAQKPAPAYPSLLWEITGNGLTQPSYLFGTMHVSNKMVFHLSDSFYHAIASCSTVSLELDPKQWQSEMFRLQQSQLAMGTYLRAPNDLLREHSFRINNDYAGNIRRALSDEPYVINGLLYRTMDGQSNFQENTYLDLYVYQTARRLGKKATGVEDYMESERIQLEAQEDMLRARTRSRISIGNENPYEIQQKIQEAYRRGNLSLLDSLSQLSGNNEAFNEKFLYGRNDIQANSIDSIIRKESLFVAVGAAHLPGKRGVIELLRAKGYTLRPVNMNDRDAQQRERIDRIRVPVQMQTQVSDDGLIELKTPGKLFRRTDVGVTESWQYADMDNGAYYMLSRIKTHPGRTAETIRSIMQKTDSLLYESIPGKILDRKPITIDGYTGTSILNRTRRGDIQHYAIVYTPKEVLVFKMSGNDDYVNGPEAEEFFGSIRIRGNASQQWNTFSPAGGGFSVAMPQIPAISQGTDEGQLGYWLYEAIDAGSGDGYTVVQKSIHNYGFIEEDSFDIALIAESLKSSEMIDKELSRKNSRQDGLLCLDLSYSLKDGGVLKARAFIRGAQYYLLTARSQNSKANFNRFFNSFHITGWKYAAPQLYTDPSLGFSVLTPVQPAIDKDLQEFLNKQQFGGYSILMNERYQPRPLPRNAYFKSDSTGEAILVSVSHFPRYYAETDTTAFWDSEMNWKRIQEDLVILQRNYEPGPDSSLVCNYVLSDTNTDRRIRGMAILKGNTLYKVQTLLDNNSAPSGFVAGFFESFRPLTLNTSAGVFSSKSAQFFADLQSSDSSTQKFARTAVNLIRFRGEDIDGLKKAFTGIRPETADYIATRTRLIQAVAQIRDTIRQTERLAWLEQLYNDYADTSMYQNAALLSIARIKTKAAYGVLKKILVSNPPVFDNNYEYGLLFTVIGDSLSLSANLFPDILQLTAFDDYRQPVTTLLAKLVDSAKLSADSYRDHFTRLFFDLQVQTRKLQAIRERELVRSQAEDDRRNDIYTPNAGIAAAAPLINNYITLLMPFYDEHPQVNKLFARLLNGTDIPTRMNLALQLIRHGKTVPDSTWLSIAASDQHRASLYERLEKINRLPLFPAVYRTQEAISRSLLTGSRGNTRFTEIQPMGSQLLQTKRGSGYAYFFRFRLQKDGDWLMAINGLQPADTTQISLDRSISTNITRKLLLNGSEREQFEKLARQTLMSRRKSAVAFFQASRPALMEGMF